MKNWKTTLCGVLMAASLYLAKNPGQLQIVGEIGVIIVPILFGLSAKDSNVTGGTTAQTTEAEKRTGK